MSRAGSRSRHSPRPWRPARPLPVSATASLDTPIQITHSGAIASLIDTIITANPDQVAQYRAGKDKVFGFFVGQVMKQSQGKANPQQVNDLLKRKLMP